MPAAVEMPGYQSHKRVWALKIAEVIRNKAGAGNENYTIVPADLGYAPIDCPLEMFSRYTPVPGDYYVVYDDGYKSFSPAKAFEEGYTRAISAELRPGAVTYVDDRPRGIGWAVKQMWDGQKVRRAGWHPGDFIVIMPELKLPPYNTQDTARKVNDRTAKYIGENTPLDSQAYFAGFAGETKQWQPGFMFRTHDLLAIDWEIAT